MLIYASLAQLSADQSIINKADPSVVYEADPSVVYRSRLHTQFTGPRIDFINYNIAI